MYPDPVPFLLTLWIPAQAIPLPLSVSVQRKHDFQQVAMGGPGSTHFWLPSSIHWCVILCNIKCLMGFRISCSCASLECARTLREEHGNVLRVLLLIREEVATWTHIFILFFCLLSRRVFVLRPYLFPVSYSFFLSNLLLRASQFAVL